MPRPPTAFTADSDAGRILLALRAGPLTATELGDRFGRFTHMGKLVSRGLVAAEAGSYRLTPAGRDLCPFRNPLAAAHRAAPAPTPPELAMPTPPEPAMPTPKNTSTRTTVLRHLTAAGALGITRQELLRIVDDEGTLNNVIQYLVRNQLVVRPAKGLLVAAEFAGRHAELAALQAVLTPTPAPGAAPADQPSVSETTDGSEAAALLCRRISPEPPPPRPPLPDPAAAGESVADDVRFALWEDGQLDICTPRGVLELPPRATQRLVSFLGLADLGVEAAL